MVVILLGPPGVGKGTQGALLSRGLDLQHISTGDLLREARRRGTDLGREAQRYMDAGELVPDRLILGLVRETLQTLPADQGVIFDGFPRTRPQAEALDEVLAELGRAVDEVIVLDAPDEVVVKRISGRRVSPSGRVYNVYYDPPRVEGVCDDTGEPLAHREDDWPATVRRRLEVHRARTEPLLGYYARSTARVIRVDASGPVGDVELAIRAAVDGDSAGPNSVTDRSDR